MKEDVRVMSLRSDRNVSGQEVETDWSFENVHAFLPDYRRKS